MHVMFRLPYWTGLLLLAATPIAGAESPLPDPIAPAVIGRPLDQIRPAPARQKRAAAKPKRTQQVAGSSRPVPKPRSAPVAAAPDARQQTPASPQVAKQAPDARAGTRAPVTASMGNRAPVTRVAFGPGAYFGSQGQALVRNYYASHPAPAAPAKWRIGERVPVDAALTGVPDDLRAALPALRRGYEYVQVDGEVVLVAVQSRTVLDGISRAMR